MKKEGLYLRIPVWMGERLDVLAYEQGQSKSDLVIEFLCNLLQLQDNQENDRR